MRSIAFVRSRQRLVPMRRPKGGDGGGGGRGTEGRRSGRGDERRRDEFVRHE